MLTDCTLHMSVVSYKSSVVAGLSLGVLNLAIVIPQVCFVQPSFLALYFAATHLNVSACKRESILPLYQSIGVFFRYVGYGFWASNSISVVQSLCVCR